MPEIEISDVIVKFPFVPNTIQRDFVSNVLKCLDKPENAVLKSPTGLIWHGIQCTEENSFQWFCISIFIGTESTFCLLTATLGWMEQAQGTPQTVIYTCKTHTQVAKGRIVNIDLIESDSFLQVEKNSDHFMSSNFCTLWNCNWIVSWSMTMK